MCRTLDLANAVHNRRRTYENPRRNGRRGVGRGYGTRTKGFLATSGHVQPSVELKSMPSGNPRFVLTSTVTSTADGSGAFGAIAYVILERLICFWRVSLFDKNIPSMDHADEAFRTGGESWNRWHLMSTITRIVVARLISFTGMTSFLGFDLRWTLNTVCRFFWWSSWCTSLVCTG